MTNPGGSLSESPAKLDKRMTRGSGNVFADIGLPNAEAHRIKALLASEIGRLLKGLPQSVCASRLGVHQPLLSQILRGRFRGVSIERLVELLHRLGQRVDVTVRTADGECDCWDRAPTVPVYRDRLTHLNDCPAVNSGLGVGVFPRG